MLGLSEEVPSRAGSGLPSSNISLEVILVFCRPNTVSHLSMKLEARCRFMPDPSCLQNHWYCRQLNQVSNRSTWSGWCYHRSQGNPRRFKDIIRSKRCNHRRREGGESTTSRPNLTLWLGGSPSSTPLRTSLKVLLCSFLSFLLLDLVESVARRLTDTIKPERSSGSYS